MRYLYKCITNVSAIECMHNIIAIIHPGHSNLSETKLTSVIKFFFYSSNAVASKKEPKITQLSKFQFQILVRQPIVLQQQ